MNPTELTHVWSEAPQLSDALSKFPKTVTRLIADAADPVGSARPAQAILAASALRYNDDVFDRLPNLRILVRTGIGIDNVDLDAATRHHVVFCNTPDGPTESTAEHTVALMLAVAKQVKPGMEQLAAGDFAPRAVPMGTELMGKTLGLVGLGRVGGRVAGICGRGFDMRVLAFDPYITAERAAEIGVEQADLDTVIGSADFLSLHAPSTPETRHLMNADRFAQMKSPRRSCSIWRAVRWWTRMRYWMHWTTARSAGRGLTCLTRSRFRSRRGCARTPKSWRPRTRRRQR